MLFPGQLLVFPKEGRTFVSKWPLLQNLANFKLYDPDIDDRRQGRRLAVCVDGWSVHAGCASITLPQLN